LNLLLFAKHISQVYQPEDLGFPPVHDPLYSGTCCVTIRASDRDDAATTKKSRRCGSFPDVPV
jgi:hypothetical protein